MNFPESPAPFPKPLPARRPQPMIWLIVGALLIMLLVRARNGITVPGDEGGNGDSHPGSMESRPDPLRRGRPIGDAIPPANEGYGSQQSRSEDDSDWSLEVGQSERSGASDVELRPDSRSQRSERSSAADSDWSIDVGKTESVPSSGKKPLPEKKGTRSGDWSLEEGESSGKSP